MKMLNLGCGSRFHPSWVNVDFVAQDAGVVAHDLRSGIPGADQSFDVVYHSHVLEHFECTAGLAFLRECRRVLVPGGIIRVAVPDLEQIVREYLACLEALKRGDRTRLADYEWMRLELYDQTVRNQSGGAMKALLRRSKPSNEAFILKRLGSEAKQLLGENAAPRSTPTAKLARARNNWRPLARVREGLLRLLLGREYQQLRVGRFRDSGEIHQCMYDSWSLAAALKDAGFQDIVRRTADESFVNDWNQWELDARDGVVHKPDSLFMEARRP